MMFDSAALTTAAAIASAGFAGFAALAAWQSAGPEKRLLQRQLTVARNEVDVEASRIEALAGQLKLAHRTLFTLGDALGNSRLTMYLNEVDKKTDEAGTLATQAASAANDATRKQIGSREAKVAGHLMKIRALREDLEREYARIEAGCMLHRQSRTGREGS